MCGRFVVLSREELATVVAAVERGEWLEPMALASDSPRGQAFPGNTIHAFGAPDGQLAVGSFHWGFPVDWSKKPVFNTRIESALSGRGMWRDLVQDGRCIVPAWTFFEPHATETVRSPKTGRQIKRAYEFADPAGAPLLMAALTDGANCSIVTAEPNAAVSSIHPRMPLILRFQEVPQWLNGTRADIEPLADRSGIALSAYPEPTDPQPESTSHQLSLF